MAQITLKNIVAEYSDQNLFNEEAADALLNLLFLRTLRCFSYDGLPYTRVSLQEMPEHNRNKDVWFMKLVDYIDRHLAKQITLDELAEYVHFNKSYLVEKFKEIWGVPPMKYVNLIRLEKAKELLTTTTKSVTDIAYETGFKSIHYFSRYFKEKENMTPHSYRTQFAEKNLDDSKF